MPVQIQQSELLVLFKNKRCRNWYFPEATSHILNLQPTDLSQYDEK
jgi:hypothetical protein